MSERPIRKAITIPSSHDKTHISTCLFIPPRTCFDRAAIIAHPYAPLGGSKHDPVVNLVAQELLDQDFIVATLDFRGAGSSGGKTSWTGKGELDDFMTVARYLRSFVQEGRRLAAREWKGTGHEKETLIILGGYSYGSMIASRAHDLFQDSANDLDENAASARSLARSLSPSHEADREPDTLERPDPDTIADTRIKTAYLLISPLLPPTTLFVAPFAAGSLWTPSASDQIHLVSNPTLAAFGDRDGFTSSERLEKWCRRLQESAHTQPSSLTCVCVAGAGHFWREDGAAVSLRSAIKAWALSLTPSSK